VTAALRLILASASPRRRELLGRLGVECEVVAPRVDESQRPGESPVGHVVRVARAKAAAVAIRYPDRPVLAADTMVVCDGEAFGKPADDAEAEAMLRRLCGRSHQVVTGVCVRYGNRSAEHVEETTVHFAAASDELLRWYVATGEPRDKAGAYAVQGIGALFVERVEGNVQAVVGLPLSPLPVLLAGVGLVLVPAAGRLRLEVGFR